MVGDIKLTIMIGILSLYSYQGRSVADNPWGEAPLEEPLTFTVPQALSYADPATSEGNLWSLNPDINRWFVLELISADQTKKYFHLENPDTLQELLFVPGVGISLGATSQFEDPEICRLWGDEAKFNMLTFEPSSVDYPYVRLCEGRLYLRLQKKPNESQSLVEWGTQLFRQMPGGESLINEVKPALVKMKEENAQAVGKVTPLRNNAKPRRFGGPMKAKVNPLKAGSLVDTKHADHIGIALKAKDSGLVFGDWYETQMHRGISVSLMIPDQIEPSILTSFPDRKVATIPQADMDNLVYLMAYDLQRYQVKYVPGVSEPKVRRDTFPEGDERYKALATIGAVPPYDFAKTVGVFIGGFKDAHSRFKTGPYEGKSYGFIQGGIELSPLSSGLATLWSTGSSVNLGVWPDAFELQQQLKREIESARQNGLLIINQGEPTREVGQWAGSNWSGDANGLGQSMRAGVCLQTQGDKSFLIFGAFTSATPSAMARVFQAYSCTSAMHLDMNAWMYLHAAIFKQEPGKELNAEYLHKDMQYPVGTKRHRYMLDNNSRDFFYVIPSTPIK